MSKLFIEMKQTVGKIVGDSSSDMLSLIGGFLNNRLTEVMRRCNLIDTSRADYSFSTVAGTEDYVLPSNFLREVSVVDKTNNVQLGRIDLQKETISFTNTLDTQGSMCKYMVLDKTVRTQPSAASVITFVSSSASDTSQTIYVKGFDANGYETYEEVTITGTTPVATSKSFSFIQLIAKSADTVGNITITSNTGAVTLAVLSQEMREHRIKIIRLYQIPNSVATIEINYMQKLLPLSQDYDYPIIDCGDVIEAGAESDAWRFKRQFGKAADLDIVFEKRLANLIFEYESQPNKVNLFNPQTYTYHQDFSVDSRYGVN